MTDNIIPANDPTPNEADLFRPIRLRFYFQDFEGLEKYHSMSNAPYMRPTFHSVDLTLGIYDTENLLGDLGKALGMPKAEVDKAIAIFRPFTAAHEGPETPPEF